MNKRRSLIRMTLIVALASIITGASTRLRADSSTCGGQNLSVPFTDVAGSTFFCDIAEAYFIGLTNGTDATHYSPGAPVPREQMAAFITRTQDSALRRGSRRAALNMWDQGTFSSGGMTEVDNTPQLVASDGEDLWVANSFTGTVSRVRASDGRLIETWTGATSAYGVLIARGRIFVTGLTNPGSLYRIDPEQAAGDVTLVTSSLEKFATEITTDGDFIWIANSDGSISKVNPNTANSQTFFGFPGAHSILYDGSNIWVSEGGDNKLKKLNSDGTVAFTIGVGNNPEFGVFDGTNIWLPNFDDNSVTIARVKDSQGNPLAQPFVLATLTGNGLNEPMCAAFDGQRILVTNFSGDSVSLWKATDLTPLGSFNLSSAGTHPYGACSDGVNFWITLLSANKLARF